MRCTSCKKVLGHLEERILELRKENDGNICQAEMLDKLGLKRLCCRKEMISYVDTLAFQQEYDECNQIKSFDSDSYIEEKNKYNIQQKKRVLVAK